MNRLLEFKIKKDIKDENIIREIVKEIENKFDINDNSNVFEIENKINCIEYSKIINKYKK